ncbi:MAG: MaoC/PaaZ C-terminal domain-containing protein [Acidimicrobiales bacterium]
MPINHDVVGAEGAPIIHSWTAKDALLYAVGVGAGIDELAFTTENSHEVVQRVLPTMAAVIGAGVSGAISAIGAFDFAMLVHGEQSFVQHRELPVEGSLTATGTITGIYDKGSGAVVAVEGECIDNETGERLLTVGSAIFIRGEGGWGGDRGPSGDRNAAPDRTPDESVSYRVRADQALTYRLSGDRNPLHSDPWFAALAGFDRPILHGLCTYGFTGRALLHTMCSSDPSKFRSMEGRFASPVFPGEQLTIEMWNQGAGDCLFQTRGEDGRVVLVGGRHTFDS